jgi:hypothetical protein
VIYWPEDVAKLLDQIERTAMKRLKGEKTPAIVGEILDNVQNVRNAMSDGDMELIFSTTLLLGLDIGHAGYKEFGLREYLNRSGRPSGRKASRDETIFQEYLASISTSRMSPTALMTKIGKQHGVGRTRAIEVIRAQLAKKPKKPSAK